MLAEQDQYGLMFALLLAIPMSFITAVDYDEFEEAMYRFEEGGVLLAYLAACSWGQMT